MNEVTARIRCSGTFHTIGIRDGRAFAAHHDRGEVEAVRVAEQIGGVEVDVPCIQMLDAIDACLRTRLPPTSDMPRAIFDYLIRRRARAVADLRHRQRHLERRVRRVICQAELASRQELGGLEDVLEGVEDEIFDRFHGQHTPFMLQAYNDAETRLMFRRFALDRKEQESA